MRSAVVKLPRSAELWLPGYVRQRASFVLDRVRPERVWFAITDHWEPLWNGANASEAMSRVRKWANRWPEAAERIGPDSGGRLPTYTFFYPEDEYHPALLDGVVPLVESGIADVEVHIHHDGEGRAKFIDKMNIYLEALSTRHGLLRRDERGRVRFGFIHGNWALDNSRPDGRWCGLNDEITILAELGCYSDFTMPSAPSPTQGRMVNQIYWASDDPHRPKSFDTGRPLTAGGGVEGDLLMIPGPLAIRWADRLIPRLETGELASYDPPTPYRVKRWFDVAPRVGGDVFIKAFSHGTQERNSSMLFEQGGLERAYALVRQEALRRGMQFYFVSAWNMYGAVEALRTQHQASRDLSGKVCQALR